MANLFEDGLTQVAAALHQLECGLAKCGKQPGPGARPLGQLPGRLDVGQQTCDVGEITQCPCLVDSQAQRTGGGGILTQTVDSGLRFSLLAVGDEDLDATGPD